MALQWKSSFSVSKLRLEPYLRWAEGWETGEIRDVAHLEAGLVSGFVSMGEQLGLLGWKCIPEPVL